MYFRLPGAEWGRNRGAGNRRALKKLVDTGSKPGLIAYAGRRPVGWCALAPRDVYRRLANSRVLAPVDDRPVWSITCFFVDRGFRRRGITRMLIEAAVAQAKRGGATLVEGYPVDPRGRRYADTFAYHGLVSAFRGTGFVETLRRSKTRPIMRRETR